MSKPKDLKVLSMYFNLILNVLWLDRAGANVLLYRCGGGGWIRIWNSEVEGLAELSKASE